MSENKLTPQPKVAAGGISAALTVVLIWTLSQVGLELPAEVAAALVMVVSFFVSYMKSDPTIVKLIDRVIELETAERQREAVERPGERG